MRTPSSEELNRIADYISGELSAEERGEAAAWIEGDESLRAIAAQWTEARANLRARPPMAADPERVVSGVLGRIRQTEGPATPHERRSNTATTPRHGVRRIYWGLGALAASVAVAVTVVSSNLRGPSAASHEQRTLTTNRGERMSIRLADGSTVILGAQSKLRYAYPFSENDRNVYLEGEAYFTVAQHSGKPFVVYTPKSATQVLGTTFLVKAYQGDPSAQVLVADGKVAFRSRTSPNGSGTTLVRGDLAQLDQQGLMTVTRDVTPNTYTSWTRGELTFDAKTLADAIPDLERWYDVKVVLADSAIGQSALVTTLDTESADQAMALIADVLNLRWTREGRVVTFSAAKARR